MLQTVRNAFKIKDIRNRIIYTFVMLLVIRFGSQLPVPGVDRSLFANWYQQLFGQTSDLLNSYTGGSFEQIICT